MERESVPVDEGGARTGSWSRSPPAEQKRRRRRPV